MTPDHDKLRELNDRLGRIEISARNLNSVLSSDIERGLVLSLAQNRERALTCAEDFYLANEIDDVLFGGGHTQDVNLTRDLNLACRLTDGLDRAYALPLSWAYARAGELAHELAHDVEMAHDTSRYVGATVSNVRRRIQAELAASAPDATVPDCSGAVSPARSALRVLHGALRVLPRRDRARYREELEFELADLAAAGTSRRAQLVHALDLTRGMWALRRALRAAAPGRERVR